MSTTPPFRILIALSGLLGPILNITSFVINVAPPDNPTVAQLITFAAVHRNPLLWGSWLQVVGTLLSVLFTIGLVHLADARERLSGWMTLFGGLILVMVSITEVTFYLSAINGNPATTGMLSLDLIAAIQHLFPLVAAPAVFLPTGIVILNSRVLPRLFGYIALALGGIFGIAGFVFLFAPILLFVVTLSFIQGIWFLAAAIMLLVPVSKSSAVVATQA